ncbi:hypothetical protein CYY_006006 [Polysphondylium violaceum]|uniref:Origin recognition complex subunit 1 n=1 Tax=Polysphondylium violaceum TaxID=133409 RepID=A0A8J4PSG6_9MYCE|nr:hypothetical protein CYY_006006 [Polysphondylium violaceum]
MKTRNQISHSDDDDDDDFVINDRGDGSDGERDSDVDQDDDNDGFIVNTPPQRDPNSSPVYHHTDNSSDEDDNGSDLNSGGDRDPSDGDVGSSSDFERDFDENDDYYKALVELSDDEFHQHDLQDQEDEDDGDGAGENLDDSQLLLTNESFSENTELDTYRNIYENVRLNLNLSTIPSELPGREKERKMISKFIETTLRANQGGGSLYVAGMPGTGKTATVKEVIRKLLTKAKERQLGDFQFLELNCMGLQDPHHIYLQMYKKMFNRRAKGSIRYQNALAAIEKSFSAANNRQRMFRVLLIDEFDMLVTKKQTVIYHLFEWANRENSKLIIIAIANTMNLHEKLLPRVKSRMNIQKVLFAPYTVAQLTTIIKTRLVGLEAFDPDSIEICAIRVASVCGDARRALEMCRQAATIANNEYDALVSAGKIDASKPPGKITVDHIDKVFKMLSTSIKSMVDQCTFYEKLFLSAVVNILFVSGVGEVSYGTIYERVITKCNVFSLSKPTIQEIQVVRSNLINRRLLIWSSKQSSTLIDLERTIRLNLPLEDLLYYFDNDPNSKYFAK